MKNEKNEWIEELRIKRGLTHEQVAELVEITRSYYTKIANGKRPSVKVAKKLAEVLGFEWVRFFDGDG